MREVFQQELAEVQDRLVEISSLVAGSIENATRAFNESDVSLAETVIADDHILRLEQLIDRLEEELPPLRRFILAGGTPAGAALHVARTVCRRAERRIVGLEPPVDPVLLRYVNRLSDLLFVLARLVNHRGGVVEIEWN